MIYISELEFIELFMFLPVRFNILKKGRKNAFDGVNELYFVVISTRGKVEFCFAQTNDSNLIVYYFTKFYFSVAMTLRDRYLNEKCV